MEGDDNLKNNRVICNIQMSRELFSETIEILKKQRAHDRKCSKAFSVILPNDFISNYDNSLLENQLVKLLQIAMDDEFKHSWIDYFMHELDFGRDYKEGCATMKDGSNIDLSSADSLYDFLVLDSKQD